MDARQRFRKRLYIMSALLIVACMLMLLGALGLPYATNVGIGLCLVTCSIGFVNVMTKL